MSLVTSTAPKRDVRVDASEAICGNRKSECDIHQPKYYLNRELSWLKFNWRVLNEAQDPRTALLDKVKFLAIVSSNIDEFCMKRIGGLRLQMDAGVTKLTVDGRTPHQQIALCAQEMNALGQSKETLYQKTLAALEDSKIYIRAYDTLSQDEQNIMRDYYIANVHPLLTPQAIDISHPFPFVSNLSLNLFVTLKKPEKRKITQARIKVPIGAGMPRFIPLPPGNGHTRTDFIRLEDIMANNLDLLFPKMEIVTCDVFRVTRNANTLADHSDAADLVEMIKAHLLRRKFAPVVRLQFSATMKPKQQKTLLANLGIDATHTICTRSSLVGMADLMELAALNRPELHGIPHKSAHNAALQPHTDIFTQISQHTSILLQHPYERFDTSVERFAKEASLDPHVKAIKMTIYRTSTNTGIINHLIEAAKNGKQVAVVVELTASFDEKANIEWARQLEQAGIHVSYGIYGLKTHCKMIMVVRKERGKLRRYAHVGTGNYHARNAKIYSDFGLLTCDSDLTSDLSELFNYLTTGCAPLRNYDQLLTAPLYIKTTLLHKISREADNARQGKPAHIRLKTNALEDPDITAALYEASQVGVNIDLIVRDICRLHPGLKGISETINIVSIVGQFLEHGRIYHFHNNGDDEYYIGSADLMTRNLERRVEILVPVKDKQSTEKLSWVLHSQITDQRNGWDMDVDGNYTQRVPQNKVDSLGCQHAAIERAFRPKNPSTSQQHVYSTQEASHG
jgi:polyphosphate kinase